MTTNLYDLPTNTGLNTVALQAHNGTTIIGHEGTTHTGAHSSRHCWLCVVLGSGRHNLTLMRRHQREAGEAWHVRATSGVGVSDPVLSRSLRFDLVLCCCVMPYSGLIFVNHRRYTTTLSPKPPPTTPHGRRRRRCCCCCSCCCCSCCAAAIVLRLRLVSPAFVSNKHDKKLDFCCCGDDRGDRARPSRAAVPQLIWRGHRHRNLRPCPRRCCCCCLSNGVVPGLPLSVSL